MTGSLDLQELLKPMTPREKMFEAMYATNRRYSDMFALAISMEGDTPVVQAYFEADVDSEDKTGWPVSLQMGDQILNKLRVINQGDDSASSEEESTDNESN